MAFTHPTEDIYMEWKQKGLHESRDKAWPIIVALTLRYESNCRESPYAKNGSVLRFLKPVWNSVCLKQPLSETNSFWNNLCNVVIYYTPLNTVYNENCLLNLDFLWCLLRNKKKTPKDYRYRSTSFYLLYYYRLWWRTSPVSVTWNICLP